MFFANRANDPQLKLVWLEQDNQEISFTDADIKFHDEQFDIAVIHCPQKMPSTPPKVKLATVNPAIQRDWSTRGFLKAGTEGDTRTDKGVIGEVAGIKRHEIELRSKIKVVDEDGWAGLSGSPVFVDKELVAVITTDYTSIESYLLAVSIPHLLVNNQDFQSAVGLTKQMVKDDITEKLHVKIISEIVSLLESDADILINLVKISPLLKGANASDIATHLIKKCSTGNAINQLLNISLKLEKQLSANPQRWNTYLENVEQLCGWLLLNSVDVDWWFQNGHEFEKSARENVTNLLELDDKAFIEVIISRSLLQSANFMLDKDGSPMPASDVHTPMLFDASPQATAEQLLGVIFKDLRRGASHAPAEVKDLIKEISKTARTLCEARDYKLIYYIVPETYFKNLTEMPCFNDLQRELAGCLQFICCKKKTTSDGSVCTENQELLLEKLAAILRLKNSKKSASDDKT